MGSSSYEMQAAYASSQATKTKVTSTAQECSNWITEKDTALYLMNTSTANEAIRLENKETKEVLFAGLIENISVSMKNHVWQAKLQICSMTKQLDIKRQKRSFQNKILSYQNLYTAVLANYPNSQFITVLNQNQTINQMILQYDETDWELLKRLTSRNQAFLVPDIKESRARFWIGLKKGKAVSVPATEYSISKCYEGYEKGIHNFDNNESLTAFQQTSFSSYKESHLGDYFYHKDQLFSIIEKKAEMKSGLLIFTYKAAPEQSLAYIKSEAVKNIGVTITGTVLSVKGHMVRVHLDIDQEQKKNEAVWLPYVTEGSNIAYYMPEIGSKVKVYFPQTNERNAMVTQGIRSNTASYSSQMSDPATKILSNLQGKKISLTSGDLSVVSDDGLSITLTDNSNIAINSSSSINMHSSGNVSFSSSQSISVSGDKGVTLQGKNISSIIVAADIQLASPDLQYTGGSGVKAIHKALEGNNKNQRKKRNPDVTPIQQLDAVQISQQVFSMIPAMLDLNALDKGQRALQSAALLANSMIPTMNKTKEVKAGESEENKKNKELKPLSSNFRAKLSLSNYVIKAVPTKNTELKAFPVKQNGNLRDMAVGITPIFSNTSSNSATLPIAAQKIERASVSVNAPAKKNKQATMTREIKPVNKRAQSAVNSKITFGNISLKSGVKARNTKTKIASKKIDVTSTKQNLSVSKIAAAANSQQTNKINVIQPVKNGTANKSSGGGSTSGSGFGVVNKGASSAISPVNLITAQTTQLIRQLNQQKSEQYINNLTLKKISSGRREIKPLAATRTEVKSINLGMKVINQNNAPKIWNKLNNKIQLSGMGITPLSIDTPLFNSAASMKLHDRVETKHLAAEKHQSSFE
ncbi:hypothetical protein IW492_17100 [Enterococcus sp. BWB1-3]|uniref:contractile injection system protein, VgrG/Pvc8 family n=1 Tax=Enterococcus sp. BWB1-3 TaxID=2787713 RepID=UPI0019225369|nr:contractile injection system protein, VgrG/Pvc8 family [Enterococcus sp. BWB1-3]MBL1230947.1 hypothetical protein [Enterococcus sp. BWB1-3]